MARVSNAGAEGLRHGRLVAPDVLHGCSIALVRLEVLTEHGKDLPVEDLELSNAFYHLLQRLQNESQRQG